MCDLGQLELTFSRGQFGHLCRQVYRKVSKHASMQVSGSNQVHRLIGNHQCNAANLNPCKAQFQLELILAQFSPRLFFLPMEADMIEALLSS